MSDKILQSGRLSLINKHLPIGKVLGDGNLSNLSYLSISSTA